MENLTETKTTKIKIIATGDVHGAIFPYDFIENEPLNTSLAQVYTYIKEQRAVKSQDVILLDNGD
ncbi:MAG: bifunctional metallophosphatase/5'-nucleotidase, partial [Bacteroidales bacterium]|nr:bifunctional metallophosphatase/5'-nucleotidase [Bacteroidales bacterium]